MKQFREFYQQFPKMLLARFEETVSGKEITPSHQKAPHVWKTVGDEILFCCRVYSIQHVSCCVSAFLLALEDFGKSLESNNIPLDVKGSGWLAAFPAENISIEIFNGVTATRRDEDILTEAFECEADAEPHKYDFLGSGIDTGFRISKNAATDKLTASMGLALILCEASMNNQFFGSFEYHGRELFKGVNRDQPYPVVSIVSERDARKRTLKERERLVTQQPKTSPVALRDYLEEFMAFEKIDRPMLPMHSADTPVPTPASYQTFVAGWGSGSKEIKERDDGIDAAAAAAKDDTSDSPLPTEVLNILQTSGTEPLLEEKNAISKKSKRPRAAARKGKQ